MIYDKAYALAEDLKKSEEYTTYKAAKDIAMENDTNRALLTEFKRLQLEAQAFMVAGKKPDETLVLKLNKLSEVLSLSTEASDFLMAEYRFNRMMGDVYKILADAVEVDLGFLKD